MIELEKEGGLWIVTINRPEKANSLTREMLLRLAEIAEEAVDAKVLIQLTNSYLFYCLFHL